ncbi:MAG: sulfatase-like hydrolase/transferase [Leptospira sp.]|nr:sulfatase-like hydrolase/transferase [Leptospira sp.]
MFERFQKFFKNEKNRIYYIPLFFIAIPVIAFYANIYIWKKSLVQHGSNPDESVLLVNRFTRWIAYVFIFAYSFLFLSENSYFGHYGAYIKPSLLIQFIYNPGEMVYFITQGAGPEQIMFFVRSAICLILIFSPAIILSKFILLLKLNKSMRYALVSAQVFFLTVGIFGLFSIEVSPDRNLNTLLQNRGTIEANFYFNIRDLFKEENVRAVENLNLPERFADPREIPFQNANIILIVMDSVRRDHIPLYGYSRNTTPFLLSRAKDFIKVDTCYAQANGTSLSFPSLIMGVYPEIGSFVKGWKLFPYLKSYGYNSGVFSSMDLRWGAGWNKAVIDYFKDDGVVKIFHAAEVPEEFRHLGFSKTIYNYGVDDGFTAAAANKWIDTFNSPGAGSAQSPLFAIVHFHSTHYSYEVPEKFNQFKPVPKLPFRSAPPWTPMLNAYDNAILRVDDAIREVFEKLESKGMIDNSIIAITSDHGESFDEHPGSYYHMTSLYETQVRVPLLFYVGKNVSKGKTLIESGRSRLTGLVDVMPTLFKAGGLKLSPAFEGVPVWGKSSKSYEKMISYHFRPKYGARTGKWKYINEMDIHKIHLYDLETDPSEKNNVAEKFPEIIKAFDGSQTELNRVGKYKARKPGQK